MKRKKGEVSIAGLAIGAAIAVIFIVLIWSMQQGAAKTIDIENESLTLLNMTGVRLAHSDIVSSSVVLWNATNVAQILTAANYSVNYDDGAITLLNETYHNMPAGINYTYEPAGYIAPGITRTVLGFVALMAAVAVIIFLVTRPGER